MVRGLFITGTNTGVGKTYVGARIARALVRKRLHVGVYKPVASGCRWVGQQLVSDDALELWQGAGSPGELERVCPQRFAAPLAPHLAARQMGQEVDPQRLRTGLEYWLERSDIVLIEGAGGLMSPLSAEDYVADLAAEFRFPLVVVSANMLGTINLTLQTLITAEAYAEGLDVAGIVLNDVAAAADDPSTASNRSELEARCIAPVLAHLAWQQENFADQIDWESLARARPS